MQVVLEMLALTDWGRLDYLIVDMPPSTGDIMMTLTSLERGRLEAIVVTTPDRLSTTVAHRALQLLLGERIPVAGVLGNMCRPKGDGSMSSRGPERLAKEFGLPLLGELPYDAKVSAAVSSGGMEELVQTRFAKALLLSMRRHMNSQQTPGRRAG
jgi:ATP-binding protein involved in chromosome partitioning